MSRKATASFKLGLASFFLTLLAGIPAVVWGFLSLREIRRSTRLVQGKWLAVSGIVLGLVGSLFSGSVLLYAVAKVRQAGQAVSMA
jgi:ABC-type phosphate transport system permease subunit